MEMEQLLIQHTLPFDGRSTSDIDGLNLDITVPTKFEASKKLPVFVFIHGGGFFTGCGSWPEYNAARIIKMSAEKGMPAIGVMFK